MLIIDKINLGGSSRQNRFQKSKQSSNMAFGSGLTQAQKSEAFRKLFSMPIDDAFQRVQSAISLLPETRPSASPVIKKASDFLKNLSEDFAQNKESLSDSVANSLGLALNDPERMFVDSKFQSIISSVENQPDFEAFYQKLVKNLYTSESELQGSGQSLVPKALNSSQKVSSPIAKKPKSTVESLLRSQEQAEAAKNGSPAPVRLGRKASHAAKLNRLKDADVAVTVSKIGALKLATQQIGHEIISYQNELGKVNAEIKRLNQLKLSKASKSKFYKNEVKREKYEAMISFEEGKRKKLDSQKVGARLENLETVVSTDKRVERKYNRYLGVFNNGKGVKAEDSLASLIAEYEAFCTKNPSIAMLTKKIDKHKKILNFNEYAQKELAKINNVTSPSFVKSTQLVSLRSQIASLTSESEALLPYYKLSQQVKTNGKVKYQYSIINYDKKLKELTLQKPDKADYTVSASYEKRVSAWEQKVEQLMADKEKSETYVKNQADLVALRQELADTEKVVVAQVQAEKSSKLQVQIATISKFLDAINPKTGLTGREYTEAQIKLLETQRAQIANELNPIFELTASISKQKNIKQNLIDKINGAQKRQNDVKHEQIKLEKMVGQGALADAKEANGRNLVAGVVEAVKDRIFAKFTKPVVEEFNLVVEDGLSRKERKVVNKERKAEIKAMRDGLSYSKGKPVTSGKAKKQKNEVQAKPKVGFKTIDVEISPEDAHELARINSRLGQIKSKVDKKRPELNQLILQLSGGTPGMFGNLTALNAEMDAIRALSTERGQAYFDMLQELRTKYQGVDHQLGLYEEVELLEEEMATATNGRKNIIEDLIKTLNEQIAILAPKREKLADELKQIGIEEATLEKQRTEIALSLKKIVPAK